jgi:hypothetical protein
MPHRGVGPYGPEAKLPHRGVGPYGPEAKLPHRGVGPYGPEAKIVVSLRSVFIINAWYFQH